MLRVCFAARGETSLTPEQTETIRQALLAGSKIEAIKLYRAATNIGLAEAKAAVEKLESQWRAASPEQFAKPRAPAASPSS